MRIPTRFSRLCSALFDPRWHTADQMARGLTSRLSGERVRLEIVAKQLGFVFVLSRSKQRADDSAQRQITIGGRFVAQAPPTGNGKGGQDKGFDPNRSINL